MTFVKAKLVAWKSRRSDDRGVLRHWVLPVRLCPVAGSKTTSCTHFHLHAPLNLTTPLSCSSADHCTGGRGNSHSACLAIPASADYAEVRREHGPDCDRSSLSANCAICSVNSEQTSRSDCTCQLPLCSLLPDLDDDFAGRAIACRKSSDLTPSGIMSLTW